MSVIGHPSSWTNSSDVSRGRCSSSFWVGRRLCTVHTVCISCLNLDVYMKFEDKTDKFKGRDGIPLCITSLKLHRKLMQRFLNFAAWTQLIDEFSDLTDANQQCKSGLKKSSINFFLRHQLEISCLFQETHKILLFVMCFFCLFFDIEKQVFLSRQKIFHFIEKI